MGPIGIKKGLTNLRSQVKNAVADAGAEIIYGDINFEMKQPGFENGFF